MSEVIYDEETQRYYLVNAEGRQTHFRWDADGHWIPNTLEHAFDKPPLPAPTGEVRVVNAQGGVKADGGKAQPRLLMQSMPNAVLEVCEVLTYGANKYSPDNWKKVESDRYVDAAYRHLLRFHAGEQNDPETKRHHLAHAVCCLLFLLEKEND